MVNWGIQYVWMKNMKSQKLKVKIPEQKPEDEFEIGKKKYFTFLHFQLHVFHVFYLAFSSYRIWRMKTHKTRKREMALNDHHTNDIIALSIQKK